MKFFAEGPDKNEDPTRKREISKLSKPNILNDNGDNIAPKSNITPFAHEAHRGPRISLGRYKGDGTNHEQARMDTEKHGNMRDKAPTRKREISKLSKPN